MLWSGLIRRLGVLYSPQLTVNQWPLIAHDRHVLTYFTTETASLENNSDGAQISTQYHAKTTSLKFSVLLYVPNVVVVVLHRCF